MFVSFFPQPRLFFTSFIVWTGIVVGFWYLIGRDTGAWFGMPPAAADAEPIVGINYFWAPEFLWFYIYFVLCTAIFAAFWYVKERHPWSAWSILGSALILFSTYFSVQVSVALNNWRRPFFDAVQSALSNPGSVTAAELYRLTLIFA